MKNGRQNPVSGRQHTAHTATEHAPISRDKLFWQCLQLELYGKKKVACIAVFLFKSSYIC